MTDVARGWRGATGAATVAAAVGIARIAGVALVHGRGGAGERPRRADKEALLWCRRLHLTPDNLQRYKQNFVLKIESNLA